MNTHIKIILSQIMFLVIVVAILFIIYPRANIDINGNFIKISSINAKVIVISENSDFSNPRYIETNEMKNVSFALKPGTYYWKTDNGIIEGFSNKFTINSSVIIQINRGSNDSELVNVGNVKINITKGKDGVLVGKIILEPNESEKIDNNYENYIGSQE